MRKSSSAARPAFGKPLINEMAGAGLRLYPHAAISDIQYGEDEWDRNHLSDKCYLISAAVQTVIQVLCVLCVCVSCVIDDSSVGFSLILLFCNIRNSPLLGSFRDIRILQGPALFACVPLSTGHCPGQCFSVCLHLYTEEKKKSSARVTRHAPV